MKSEDWLLENYIYTEKWTKTYKIYCTNFVNENTANQYHTKWRGGCDAVKRHLRHCSRIWELCKVDRILHVYSIDILVVSTIFLPSHFLNTKDRHLECHTHKFNKKTDGNIMWKLTGLHVDSSPNRNHRNPVEKVNALMWWKHNQPPPI